MKNRVAIANEGVRLLLPQLLRTLNAGGARLWSRTAVEVPQSERLAVQPYLMDAPRHVVGQNTFWHGAGNLKSL